MIELSGVRISWLILARKSDLAVDAISARRLASTSSRSVCFHCDLSSAISVPSAFGRSVLNPSPLSQRRRLTLTSGSGPYVFDPAVPRKQPISTNPQAVIANPASASM